MNIKLPNSNELGHMVAKGMVWSGAQIFGGKLVSFIVFALLSRLVKPEAFGIVALATLFISFAQIFLDQGFGDAIVQRADLEQEHLDTAFWANVLAGGLITLITFVSAPLIANLFREPSLVLIIPWLSLSFFLAGLSSTQQAILRRQLAFKELAGRSLIAAFVGGVAGVVLALLGFGVWSLVALDLVTGLVGVVVLWNISIWRPKFRFSPRHFNHLFSFGLNIIGINFLNFLNRHADDLLIGYYLGTTMLGYYTIAYRILTTMTDLFTTVTNAVALPTFSRLQHDFDRIRSAFYLAVHFTGLISIPAFLGVVLVAPELIYTIFGPQWTLSISVIQILAFIGILHSIFYFHNSLVISVGKPSWRLGITLLNAVSNVIAFAFAVRWGIVAVAAAYVIRGYILSPIEIWMVRKLAQIDIKTYFAQFVKPLVGSLAMAIVIWGLRLLLDDVLDLRLRLGAYVFTGGTAYLLVVYFLEPSFWPQIIRLVQSGFATKPVE
ncbi:MAG: lipopolysaccharide biosynthesis protein [Chloroflexi bacterium]|nr:lipopolysaccharide biosynthesis protein [Chloroflexota bacterium]